MNDNANTLKILDLFRSLRAKLTNKPEGAITSQVWADASNGRITVELGPPRRTCFVSATVSWEALRRHPTWEATLNWAALGSMDMEAAGVYADVLKRLTEIGPELRAMVESANVTMKGHHDQLALAWKAAKQRAGEDAKPNKVAQLAYRALQRASSEKESRGNPV